MNVSSSFSYDGCSCRLTPRVFGSSNIQVVPGANAEVGIFVVASIDESEEG